MFDVGFTEILLIGIVSLVVIGPERLPVVAKTAGQWIGKLQRFVRGVKSDLASELESGDLKKLIGDQREQINELKNMVNSAKKDFENSTRDVVKGAKKSLGELETSVKELDRESTSAGGISADRSAASTTELNQISDAAVSKDEFVRMSGQSAMTSKDDVASKATSSTVTGQEAAAHCSESPGATDGKTVQTNPSIPPDNSGGQQTPTLHSDSSSPKDDSANMNRTGTEPGS